MGIEPPEAKILAEQVNRELRGKRIKSCHVEDYERLQKIGMLDKDTKSFDQLVNGKIEFVISRGNVIRVKLSNWWKLSLNMCVYHS